MQNRQNCSKFRDNPPIHDHIHDVLGAAKRHVGPLQRFWVGPWPDWPYPGSASALSNIHLPDLASNEAIKAGLVYHVNWVGNCPRSRADCLSNDRHLPRSENLKFYVNYVPCSVLARIKLSVQIGLENGRVFPALPVPTPICLDQVKIS